MCWGRDRTAGSTGVKPPSPPRLEARTRSAAAGLSMVAVEEGWSSWTIALVWESRTMPRLLGAIVALNARLNEKIDWAEGCHVPVVLLSWRLRRCRIAIIAVAARIDASYSSSPLLVGGSGSPVNALRIWPWVHSGLARPSLRKGRGAAIAKRPSEEEGGYELDEKVRGWPIETVVGDEYAVFDDIVGVASARYKAGVVDRNFRRSLCEAPRGDEVNN